MKKTMTILTSVLLLMSIIALPVNAAVPENTVQPRWTNTSNIDCTVAAVDGVGYAECVVTSQAGATSIKIDIIVYEAPDNVWIYKTELHDIKYKRVSGVSCSFSVNVGCHYRADYTFTVTKGGVDEVITRTCYFTYEG